MAARPGQRGNEEGDGPQNGMQTFAEELRAQREAAGLTQEQAGKLMGYSASVIAKLETCRTIPSPEHAAMADKAFKTPGTFGRIRAGMITSSYEPWFRPFVEHEAAASALRWYEPLLVPGLLQTEDYARAVFQGAQPDAGEEEIERLVAGRLERQAIMGRENPPHFWCVLDEGVLHRCIGGEETMGGQVRHLAEMARRPRVSVQVIPSGAGAHPGLLAHFVIADIDGGQSVVYLETATEGLTVEVPSVIAKAVLAFDMLRSEALPRGTSLDLIMKVAEERWKS